MRTNIIIVLTLALIGLAGCHSIHKESHPHETTHEHEHGHDHSHDHDHGHAESSEHTDEIIFTREQAEAVGLATEVVARGVFHHVIKTSGSIEVAQGDETKIVATADGVVTFSNPSITEGMAVRAGQAIATLSAKHIQDGDPATRARIEFETAEKEFQRAEILVKDRIISEKEFEQARLRYETAKTAYDAHGSNLSPEGIRVVSPISGYIANREVAQGEYVSVGQPIATVARNSRLHLKAEVPESHYLQLKDVATAHFKSAYSDQVYKLSELDGRLLSYGKTTGTSFFLPVTFEFANQDGILPGAYTEVYLLSAPREEVISIPVSAVTEEQGLYFVYLQLDEECYKKQEVTLGPSDGDRIEVLSGLQAGDRLVTHGVTQVKLAAVGSVMPEGHSHSH